MYSVEINLSYVILPVRLLLLIHRNLVLILPYKVLILLFHSTHMCFTLFTNFAPNNRSGAHRICATDQSDAWSEHVMGNLSWGTCHGELPHFELKI